jgi:hypothetical protein
MVCDEAAVGNAVEFYTSEQLTAAPQPSYVDALYTCPYRLPSGTVTLSVKELADPAATTAWFDGLRARLGSVGKVYLGEDGFQTPAGSIVVRKDDLVLLVDTTTFADLAPPRSRSEVATNIAFIVMACWE